MRFSFKRPGGIRFLLLMVQLLKQYEHQLHLNRNEFLLQSSSQQLERLEPDSKITHLFFDEEMKTTTLSENDEYAYFDILIHGLKV